MESFPTMQETLGLVPSLSEKEEREEEKRSEKKRKKKEKTSKNYSKEDSQHIHQLRCNEDTYES